ncbi:MAG: hypothetical protein RIS09_200 [Actinomycetota bacterium]
MSDPPFIFPSWVNTKTKLKKHLKQESRTRQTSRASKPLVLGIKRKPDIPKSENSDGSKPRMGLDLFLLERIHNMAITAIKR